MKIEDALYLIACCKDKEPLGRGPAWPEVHVRPECNAFPALDGERIELIRFLSSLTRDEANRVYSSRKALSKIEQAWRTNLSLESWPTMVAIRRYRGTLYQELDDNLENDLRLGSIKNLLIVSALFGLLHPLDMIPDYELMMKDAGPGTEPVCRWWQRAFAHCNLPQLLREYMPDLRRVFCFMSESSGYISAVDILAEHFDVYVIKVHNGGFHRSPEAWGRGVRSCLQAGASAAEQVSDIVRGEECTLVSLPVR